MKAFTGKVFEFKSAIDEYRSAITSQYYSNDRDGGRQESDVIKERIIELYRKSPKESKIVMLYVALKTMTKPLVLHGGDRYGSDAAEKLAGWLSKLGDKLTTDLEDI